MARGHDPKWKGRSIFKPFKIIIIGLKDKVFKSGEVKDDAQFTKTSEEIADYVQMNFNSDIVEAIRKVKQLTFTMPKKPTGRLMINKEGRIVTVDLDEMDIFIKKKVFERQYKKQT